jgi:coenzyme F420 hydrogenase subunit beta
MRDENKLGFGDIDASVCTQCGACVSICPVGALTLDGQGVRLTGECVDCGLCHRFCPGREVDFLALSKRHLGSTVQDPLLGHHRRLAVAQAASEVIREQSASGGVVTALLLHLRETNQTDGALGVTMDDERPWLCHGQLLTTSDEIKHAAQSKYSLVSLDALLRSVRAQPGSFTMVGLPCHVHGLRRLQRLGSYRAKFPLSIGLFCGFNLLPAATDHLIAKVGFTNSQVARLQYRGGPWPGGFLLHSKEGARRFIPKHSYSYVNLLYVPRRCLACPDLTNELADLSVGDCWLEEHQGGWSTVVCRSAQGERVLGEAEEAGVVIVRDVRREDVLRSHAHLLAYKKDGYFVRQKWLRIPLHYKLPRPAISRRRWVEQSMLLFLLLGLGNRWARALVGRLPLSWLSRLSLLGRQAATSGETWQRR